MPVLRTFYNNGNVRMAVTEDELLSEWKAFFDTGTNWKDLKKDISRQDYLNISDRAHRSNIRKNPVHFLLASGQGLFVEKEGTYLSDKYFEVQLERIDLTGQCKIQGGAKCINIM